MYFEYTYTGILRGRRDRAFQCGASTRWRRKWGSPQRKTATIPLLDEKSTGGRRLRRIVTRSQVEVHSDPLWRFLPRIDVGVSSYIASPKNIKLGHISYVHNVIHTIHRAVPRLQNQHLNFASFRSPNIILEAFFSQPTM